MASRPATATAALFDGDELEGEVVGTYYADTATGFGVVEVQAAGEEGGLRCAGPLADLVEGQTVRLIGSWNDHPRYGRTFEVTFYEQTTPATVAGLRTFLASERFDLAPGVVNRVLAAFGSRTGAVIEDEPGRLEDEAGLDARTVEHLREGWRHGKALADLVRLLEPVGVPYAAVRQVFAHFQADAVAALEDDPYALLEAPRASFRHADALADRLGVEPLDPRRLAAGARAAHRDARRRDGHQYLTRTQCAEAAAALLGVDEDAVDAGIERAVSLGTLAADGDDLYTPAGLAAETGLAADVARLLDSPRSRARAHLDDVSPSDELTAGQRSAVRETFASPVTVLTGGPGTGKTRSVQEVVAAAAGAGLHVALCAPTGRAAKRLEELVGHPATTVHRLLDARPISGPGGTAAGFAFRHGRDDPLPQDLVVCDEVSMCDTWLASRLLAAVDDGAHLLLVGDPDQLPPVGTGDVLRDLLRSRTVPTVTLTEIHRQAAESRIVALARALNCGELTPPRGVDGDVFMAEERDRRRIVPRVVTAVSDRIPAYFDVDVADVQVVAPVYRGPAGVDALNAALREALNPPRGGPSLGGFRAGDRVMQTRNDAELDVSNGDVGHVADVDAEQGRLRVVYPRGEVAYDRGSVGDLTLAWAITVHKSQGGEWPVLVFVCDRSHAGMLWRNLAYTAVTRAQRALVVVGQAETLARAAGHDRPRNRQTRLAERLRSAIDGHAGIGRDGDGRASQPD